MSNRAEFQRREARRETFTTHKPDNPFKAGRLKADQGLVMVMMIMMMIIIMMMMVMMMKRLSETAFNGKLQPEMKETFLNSLFPFYTNILTGTFNSNHFSIREV